MQLTHDHNFDSFTLQFILFKSSLSHQRVKIDVSKVSVSFSEVHTERDSEREREELYVMQVILCEIKNCTFSRASIPRTPIARLPWLIRTRFESLRNSFSSSRKQILREFFY